MTNCSIRRATSATPVATRIRRSTILAGAIAGLATAPEQLAAQERAPQPTKALSLEEAIRLAEPASEVLAMHKAQLGRAAGARLQSSSPRLPRIAAYTAYDRSLRSEFDDLPVFAPDSTARGAEEDSGMPFGSDNTYRVGITVQQSIFSGGRHLALSRAAKSAERSAELGLTAARAQLVLDVTEAYYDAVLSDRLVNIAQASLAQAESTYRQVSLVTQVGRGSEFEALRARVARDRQRPVLIRYQASRELAMLRLKQLVHVPSESELALVDALDEEPSATVARSAALSLVRAPASISTGEPRAAVRQATEAVRHSEQLLHAARASRYPALSLVSTYERVAYPREGIPAWDAFRTNWTVGARVDLPLFTGGDRRGGEVTARADVEMAKAQLRQTEQLSVVDARSAAARLAAAEAAWQANESTVREAARAYEIASLRHREGLSIQLELTDARILLEEARAERARAARDLAVERTRAALLPFLPLDGSASAGQSGADARPMPRTTTSSNTLTSGAR